MHAAPQISYNCVTNPKSTSGHCYGLQFWGGANGADTRITLHQTNGGQGFVDNEMWLVTSSFNYWVEAGIKSSYAFRFSDASVFFWADSRPNGGGYAEHYSTYLTGSDYSQANALTRITRSGTSSWNVLVNDNVTLLTGTSINNNITIGYIEIGMEVYGNGGANALTNHFTNNRWLNGSNFQYQNNDGDFTEIFLPVSAGWTTDPPHSSTGGDWHTCIPGSGC
ncbi:MAG: hypothetical protein ABI406_04440 [Ktedonobacteraceae bacterium]